MFLFEYYIIHTFHIKSSIHIFVAKNINIIQVYLNFLFANLIFIF